MMATETKLDLEGMHCASCAASIERRLNELDGVAATVNLATARATVHSERPVPVYELVAAVESIGYGAAPAVEGHHHHEEMGPLRRRLVVAAVLTVPVALLAMVPSIVLIVSPVGRPLCCSGVCQLRMKLPSVSNTWMRAVMSTM